MSSITHVHAAREALTLGDLARAESLLGVTALADPEAATLRAEILLLRGLADRALKLIEELFARAERAPSLRATLLFLAGGCTWELGDLRRSADYLQRASGLAKEARDWVLLSRIQLQMLENTADSDTPYDVSLPLCAAAIRSVHRAGEQRILAEAHLTFARLEARGGANDQAIRHLVHVNRLLEGHQNSWLKASARLTAAIVYSLQGDFDSACETAQSAAELAKASGWTKGEALAAGSLAFFYTALGRIELGEQSISRAEAAGYSSPSFQYAIRDTRMAVALAACKYDEVDRLWTEGQTAL